MKLIIEDDEGRKTVVPLVRDEISIGRLEGNTIRLTERNVSRRHARLLRQNGSVFIEDLGSYTGVRVNGEKIASRHGVKEGDLIEIGDYDLQIEGAPEKIDSDTNPTVKEDMAHIHAPKDRTPPLASPPPPVNPSPAPRASAAQPPSTTKKSEATAMIRLSDLNKGGDADGDRDLAPNEQPRLVGLSGPFRGREFPLRRSIVKIGRQDDGNDIAIDHQSMSRQHAKFQIEGGVWKLYDNKSANGIRVNGDEYGMSPVKPGDTIELGHVKFRFCAPGEAFTPPREAPQSVTAAPTAVQQEAIPAPAKNKVPLIIAGVVVLALVGVIVVLLTGKKGGKGPDAGGPEQYCQAGQAALALQNWSECAKQLNIAKTMGATCGFPLDETLRNCKQNLEAKQNLDDADQLMQEGKFRQVLPILKGIPDGTAYDSEKKLKINDARKAGVRKYAADARDSIERNKLDEAKQLIDEITNLEPDAEVIPMLQKDLAEKRARNAAATPKEPPPPAKKPQAERDAAAEKLLGDANGLIKGGNLAGGIDMLKKVLAEDPSVALQGKAWRNLGVANARAGNTDEAVKCYKQYLKLVPDAPERAKIEQLIQGH